MSSMQSFYERLSAASEGSDAYLQALAQLLQATLVQAAAVQSDLDWNPWDAATAAKHCA